MSKAKAKPEEAPKEEPEKEYLTIRCRPWQYHKVMRYMLCETKLLLNDGEMDQARRVAHARENIDEMLYLIDEAMNRQAVIEGLFEDRKETLWVL